jgi:hypothetical protein
MDWHTCHFCGDDVKDGKDLQGNRHWLSDCRPDLVEHEPGETCTWHNMTTIGEKNCYAFQDRETNKWTDEHKHFYKDGPM